MKKIALVTILSLVVFSLIASPLAHADYLLDRSSTLVSVDGSILGDDDTKVEVEHSGKTEPAKSDAAPTASPRANQELEQQHAEQERETAKKLLEKQIETRKKQSENQGTRSKVELETSSGKFKLKQETKDKFGKTQSKEVELRAGESLHIQDKEGNDSVELKLGDAPNSTGPGESRDKAERVQKLEIIKDQIKAKFDDEGGRKLSVNENNELVVTRPDGTTKVVTVLPDQAVENMRRHGVTVADTTTTPELTENESGEPVYRVENETERNILGLKLKFKRATEVSAETGAVTTKNLETNGFKKWLAGFIFSNN